MPEKILKKWIKTKQGRKGLVVGTCPDGKNVLVGWSLCRKGDKFDPELAKTISLGRTLKTGDVPASLVRHVNHMEDRCKRYFLKGSN